MLLKSFSFDGKEFKFGMSRQPSVLIKFYHVYKQEGFEGEVTFDCRQGQWMFFINRPQK